MRKDGKGGRGKGDKEQGMGKGKGEREETLGKGRVKVSLKQLIIKAQQQVHPVN